MFWGNLTGKEKDFEAQKRVARTMSHHERRVEVFLKNWVFDLNTNKQFKTRNKHNTV